MTWAGRITAIMSIPWGLLVLFLAVSAHQHATGYFLFVWMLIWAVPTAVIYTICRLAFGDRGAVRRY